MHSMVVEGALGTQGESLRNFVVLRVAALRVFLCSKAKPCFSDAIIYDVLSSHLSPQGFIHLMIHSSSIETHTEFF